MQNNMVVRPRKSWETSACQWDMVSAIMDFSAMCSHHVSKGVFVTKTSIHECIGLKICTQTSLLVVHAHSVRLLSVWWRSYSKSFILIPTNLYIFTRWHPEMLRVTDLLWGESTVHRYIPLTKASEAKPLMLSLICAWTNDWANKRDPGDLRRHRVHYHVIVM